VKESIVGFAVTALASCMLMADTVIWYRFDDQEPLTSTAAGVYVTNCVAATYPAHPRTIKGIEYNDNDETTPTAGYLPTYTNSSPVGYSLYDPVSGACLPNRGCLHFHSTGSSDSFGGMLRVDQDEALEALTNLTLEAFVRLPTDVPITSGYMRPVILKVNESYRGTWGLHVFESNIFFRCTLKYEDGSTNAKAWGNGSRSVRIDDGRWHHLAVTFDFATQSIKSYVDYTCVNDSPMMNSDKKATGFYHPAYSPLLIGGNEQVSGRRFNGEIDEVRISDEALPPEKFLRYIPIVNCEIDADTVLYLAFDKAPVDWFSKMAQPINAATNAPGPIAMETGDGAAPASFTNEVAGISIRNGIYSPEAHANDGSIHLPVSGEGAHNGTSFLLRDPHNLVSASSFTIETFVKTDRQTTRPASGEYSDSFAIFYADYMKLLMNGSGKQTLFRYAGSLGGDQSTSVRLDDCDWHHVAFVYDASLGLVTGYIDYRQVVSNVVGTGSFGGNLRISGERPGYQTLPGCLDEVRITRRALKVTEFLMTHACLTGSTLAHADFENDMDVSPDTGFIDAGIASARTDGSVPVLSDCVPGRIFLDGEAMQEVRQNRKSVRVDGGKIAWKEHDLLNLPSFTVEFFARLDGLDALANLIRLTRGTEPDGNPVWALVAWNSSTLRICAKDDTEIRYLDPYNFDTSIADGKWHHWAITFDGTSGTDTVMTLYRDYTSLGSRPLSTPIHYQESENTLTIGGTLSNPAHIHGNFDELRVSDGVLPTSAFMRAQPNGTVMIVR